VREPHQLRGSTLQADSQSRKDAKPGSWLASVMARKPPMLVRVALANKMARTVWALARPWRGLSSSGRGGVSRQGRGGAVELAEREGECGATVVRRGR
jgi:hypothetical protein